MHLARLQAPVKPYGDIVVLDDGEIRIIPDVTGMGDLLRRPAAEIRDLMARARPVPGLDELALGAPVDPQGEVWAAGVTYRRSREARAEESRQADVYDRVYDAERPELFFKSVGWRVVGDGAPIAVRDDALLTIPEPELAVVVNSAGELVGYTVCDDVTARDLEAENPLYLPQAKIYAGSCAVGPWIRPAWEVDDPHALDVTAAVYRDGQVVWQAATSTAQLQRRLPELVRWLFRGQAFPRGVVLSTGTGLVPDLTFTLVPDDVVEVCVAEVGTLRNTVTTTYGAMPAPPRPTRRCSTT